MRGNVSQREVGSRTGAAVLKAKAKKFAESCSPAPRGGRPGWIERPCDGRRVQSPWCANPSGWGLDRKLSAEAEEGRLPTEDPPTIRWRARPNRRPRGDAEARGRCRRSPASRAGRRAAGSGSGRRSCRGEARANERRRRQSRRRQPRVFPRLTGAKLGEYAITPVAWRSEEWLATCYQRLKLRRGPAVLTIGFGVHPLPASGIIGCGGENVQCGSRRLTEPNAQTPRVTRAPVDRKRTQLRPTTIQALEAGRS